MPLYTGTHLPAEIKNRVINDRLDLMFERINAVLAGKYQVYPDGGFIGASELPAREKFSKYLAQTVDLSDLARIADPGYEVKLRTGLLPADDPGPVSPFWKRALSIPGVFTDMSKEFTGLMEKYAGSVEVGHG